MRMGLIWKLGIFVVALGGMVWASIVVAGLLGEPPALPKVKMGAQAPAGSLQQNPFRGGNVNEGRLLRKVEPVFPAAIRNKDWTPLLVTVEAIVDETGNVESVKILKGHPVCNDAVVRAVSQWRYTPTVANGTPVKVMMRISLPCGKPEKR
jgi:TonB family protein